MKQIIKIIRKVDFESQYVEVLNYELDYELATLHEAIQTNDLVQREKSNARLEEIREELVTLGVLKQ